MKSNAFRTVALAVAGAMLLGGCASLLGSSEPPPAIYVLHPALNDAARPASAPAVIEIPRPEVPSGFDVDKIALYWDQGRRLDYYAAARWPAPLDKLLQNFISQSASHALPGMTVVSPDLNLPARYRLAVKVIEMQPVYKDGPAGTPGLFAALHFTLIALPEERVIDDFTVAENATAASGDLTSVTGGLETLLQTIMTQAYDRLAPRFNPADTTTDD